MQFRSWPAGEDVKEYYAYEDSSPTHSYTRMRYFYPMGEFPYAALVTENARRSRLEREYELWDAYGPEKWMRGEYWDIKVEYAKASPTEMVCRVVATNASAAPAELHVLPHLLFRNTWSWGYDDVRPRIEERDSESPRVVCAAAYERHLGDMRWAVFVPEVSGSVLTQPLELLLTDNESNFKRLYGDVENIPPGSTHKKDAFHTHVTGDNAFGAPGSVSTVMPPGAAGTKAAAWAVMEVMPGASAEVWVRFSVDGNNDAVTSSVMTSPPTLPTPAALSLHGSLNSASMRETNEGEAADGRYDDDEGADDEDDDFYGGGAGTVSGAASVANSDGDGARLATYGAGNVSERSAGGASGDGRLAAPTAVAAGTPSASHAAVASQPFSGSSPNPMHRSASLRRSGTTNIAAGVRTVRAASFDEDITGAYAAPTRASAVPVRAELCVTGNVYGSPLRSTIMPVADAEPAAAAPPAIHVVTGKVADLVPLTLQLQRAPAGALFTSPPPLTRGGGSVASDRSAGGKSSTFMFLHDDHAEIAADDASQFNAPHGLAGSEHVEHQGNATSGRGGLGGQFETSVASGMFGMTRALSYHSDGHHGDFAGNMSTASLLGVNAASMQLAPSSMRRHVPARVVGAAALDAAARRAAARAHDVRGPLRFHDVLTIVNLRREETDQFYEAIQAPGLSDEDAAIQRQAFAGLLFSKTYYHYGVRFAAWLDRCSALAQRHTIGLTKPCTHPSSLHSSLPGRFVVDR